MNAQLSDSNTITKLNDTSATYGTDRSNSEKILKDFRDRTRLAIEEELQRTKKMMMMEQIRKQKEKALSKYESSMKDYQVEIQDNKKISSPARTKSMDRSKIDERIAAVMRDIRKKKDQKAETDTSIKDDIMRSYTMTEIESPKEDDKVDKVNKDDKANKDDKDDNVNKDDKDNKNHVKRERFLGEAMNPRKESQPSSKRIPTYRKDLEVSVYRATNKTSTSPKVRSTQIIFLNIPNNFSLRKELYENIIKEFSESKSIKVLSFLEPLYENTILNNINKGLNIHNNKIKMMTGDFSQTKIVNKRDDTQFNVDIYHLLEQTYLQMVKECKDIFCNEIIEKIESYLKCRDEINKFIILDAHSTSDVEKIMNHFKNSDHYLYRISKFTHQSQFIIDQKLFDEENIIHDEDPDQFFVDIDLPIKYYIKRLKLAMGHKFRRQRLKSPVIEEFGRDKYRDKYPF